MKKCLNAWSVDGKTGFKEMFSELKDAGFDGVELNLDRESGSAHSLTFSTSPAALAEIKRISDYCGLPVVSVSSSLYGSTMGSPVTKDREYAREVLLRQLDCAAALGAGGILIVPGGLSEEVSLKTARENSLETLRSLKEEIEAAKILVGVENVWNRFFTSPFDMLSFINETGCGYICAYFDIGNVVAFSDPENWIEILGDKVRLVHVKDFKRQNGTNTGGEWVDIRKGSVNWKKVVAALRTIGFDGCLTAEVSKSDRLASYSEFYLNVSSALDSLLKL